VHSNVFRCDGCGRFSGALLQEETKPASSAADTVDMLTPMLETSDDMEPVAFLCNLAAWCSTAGVPWLA